MQEYNTELRNKLIERNGWVQIAGLGIERMVTVEGVLVDPAISLKYRQHSPDGFNWGYNGSGPAQLSLGILLLYLPPEQAIAYTETFKRTIVALLPQESFYVEVNIGAWIAAIKGRIKTKVPTHAYSYMKVSKLVEFSPARCSPLILSKFIDLPALGCKTAIFKDDTIEYELLQNVKASGLLDDLRAYCGKGIGIIEKEDSYTMVGGNGEMSMYSGHKKGTIMIEPPFFKHVNLWS